MDDILSNLMVILVLAVIGVSLFLFFRRRQAAAEKELSQVALAHGWQLETLHEPLAWGVRISGQGWTLEAISRSSAADAAPGSSNVSMSTRWQAPRPGSALLLGPARSSASVAGQYAGPLTSLFTGANMHAVSVQNTTLANKYMLWAETPAEAEALLSPAVCAALLAWKQSPPLVRRDQSGMQMELAGERLKSPADLLAFIRIGEALLATLA
jgi:hypothetical protein